MHRIPNPDLWAKSGDQLRALSSEEHEASLEIEHIEEARQQALRVVRKLWNHPVETFFDASAFREFQQHGIPWFARMYLLYGWTEEWGAPIPARLPFDTRADIEPERESWVECGKSGILPIGTESIINVRVGDVADERGKQFATLWAPFDGDIYADCVVRARFGRTTCHAFSLVEPVHDEDTPYAGWITTGKTDFYISGDPSDAQMQRWMDVLRSWNAKHSDEHLSSGPGRRKGSTYLPIDEVLEKLASERLAGRARTQLEFAGTIGVSERTLRDYLLPLGGWGQVLETVSTR